MSTTKDLSDIFTANMGLWHKVARENLNDEDYAEDLVNDAYLRLAERHTEVKEYNKEYIVRTVKTMAINHNALASNREYTNHRELEGDGFDATAHTDAVVNNPAADWLAPDEQDPERIYLANNLIEDAFKAKILTKNQADALIGVTRWGFTQEEVAKKTGVDQATVSRAFATGISKLREHYGADCV